MLKPERRWKNPACHSARSSTPSMMRRKSVLNFTIDLIQQSAGGNPGGFRQRSLI